MRLGLSALTLLLVATSGCAPTTGPLAPPVEVLVVLDRTERVLRVIPTDSVGVVHTISLGEVIPEPTTLAVHGTLAAVGLGSVPGVLVIDLAGHRYLRTITTQTGGAITAVAFGPDGMGYAATPDANSVTIFEPSTGSAALVNVPGGPAGFGFVRGQVYVVSSNRRFCSPQPDFCQFPGKPSWLNLINGAVVLDSIGLLGPGNASPTAVAPDGQLYVLNSGDGSGVDGVLSGVDPVLGRIASFTGFGPSPRLLAADGFNHLLIAGDTEGLMVFNTRDRSILRGAGSGIPLTAPTALTTDGLGRTYVVEGGSCQAGGAAGRVRIFGNDLVERPGITLGVCPVAAAVTEIPAEQYNFGG